MVCSARRVLNKLQIYDLHGTMLVAMTKLQMIPQSRRRHQLIEYCWGFPGWIEWPCDAMPDWFKTFAENSTGSGEKQTLFLDPVPRLGSLIKSWTSDLRTRGRRSKGGKKYCNQEVRWEYYCVLGELIGIVWQLFCNSCMFASIPWWKGGPFYPRHRVKIKGLVIWELVGKKMRFWGMLEAFHSRGSSDSNHLLPITLFCLLPRW